MVNAPPLKNRLFWCRSCNLPLLGQRCGCGNTGEPISLQKPYDVRPALAHDRALLSSLLFERFGTAEIPQVVLLNKTGGVDRNDLLIINGERFGWLTFDPLTRRYQLDLEFGALHMLSDRARTGIVDITPEYRMHAGRMGGKKIAVDTDLSDGSVIIRAGSLTGVGRLKEGHLRVKKLGRVSPPGAIPDPGWEDVIRANHRHLKNLERNAVRFIRQQARGRECVNVAFSGGKDSTVALALAEKAGIEDSYFVDTGMEFPETLEFVRSMKIRTVLGKNRFWNEVGVHGIPQKDDRWCCERLKLDPVREWMGEKECLTVQGNRAYESFARSRLDPVQKNPFNPRQTNISPLLGWRALEVFLYIWWRGLPENPLYGEGFERVGCWMCPAMLEAEWELVRERHPELFERWTAYLNDVAAKSGKPPEYVSCGIWRWKEPPPKMKELIGRNP